MRAVTVTSEVMGVPELVMNTFSPLITHSSPSSSARVRVAPASEPASGSVRPKAPSARPATRSGSHRAFCSSVPNRWMGLAPSDTPASRVMASEASTRAISSIARHRVSEAGPRAPVLLGEGEPEEAQVAHLPHHFDREVMVPVPLGGVRGDLRLGELPDHLAKRHVLRGRVEVHCYLPMARRRPNQRSRRSPSARK